MDYDNMTDDELVNTIMQLLHLVSERFEMRARETQELIGEEHDLIRTV